MWRILLTFGLILSVGCEGDASGPGAPNLTGLWTYSATNLHAPGSPGGVSCSVVGASLSITQTGETFAGTYYGGTVSCSNGGSYPFGNEYYDSVEGSVSGSAEFALVGFNLERPYDWTHRGTLSGNTMGGTINMWGLEFCGEYGCYTDLLMTGDWVAQR